MSKTQTQREWGPRAAQAQRRMDAAVEELDRRQRDAVRLYKPMPAQEEFHRCKSPVRIIRAGNRSGKTLAVTMEVARAARQMDPHKKYTKKRPLIIWMIVYSEDNIGRTLFRMLFKPGQFRMIRDLHTNNWRVYDPSDPSDASRKGDSEPAPPFIPADEIHGGSVGMAPSECRGFTWIAKGSRIFKSVRLKNGTELRTFCSNSEPPMGDPVDIAVIDEDLKQNKQMVSELMARIADEEGCIIWSVWPKSKNDALERLSRQAREEEGKPDPDVTEFRMKFSGNQYISKRAKERTLRLWATQGENVLKSRDEGDFGLDDVLMYPEYDLDIHGVPNMPDPKCIERGLYQGNVDWFLRTRKIPADWTRFMWVDPGWGTTAVLFMAIPPPAVGDFVVAYDELYLHKKVYGFVAKEIARKIGDQQIYLFGIDNQHGRKHNQGTGKTEKQQLVEALKALNVRSVMTGHGFKKGSTDVTGRIGMVRSWLSLRADGTPKFRILRSKADPTKTYCPNMEFEFSAYRRRLHQDEAREDPVDKHNHIMATFEYFAHDRASRYVKPSSNSAEFDPVTAAVEKWSQEEERRNGGKHTNLGPCVNLP